jgi:RHS repeat-associated protein
MGSLIAVNLPDGRLIEYVTDGKGRRIGKMVNGVLTKQWLYRDQLKPVAELDGSGNLVSEFIYGTKANVPDLVVRGGVTYRVISDQLGSPVYAVNTANSSDVPFQATYSAWGERTLVTGTDDWMPFGFAGGQYDPGTKLTRFGARDFDPTIGRWVSKDPIRFEGGQTSIYAYVGNDPVNRLDMFGKDNGDFSCAFNLARSAMNCATCIVSATATALGIEVAGPMAAYSCPMCENGINSSMDTCQPAALSR